MMEKTCDILVLGGGGAGLVAAARAAELSGKKVIVLEKAKKTGGGMIFASTMRTFGSQWQKERNIPDQSNDFLRKMMDLTLWKLDAELARNAILGTGEFFDWYSTHEKPELLEQYRVGQYIFDIPFNGQEGPQYGGFQNGSGRIIMETMLRLCEKLGVEVLTEHRALDAEVENGKIAAVTADSPEGEVRITCSACILACGSWIRNKEVVGKVYPAYLDADVMPNPHQNPNYTGDGLPIAEKVGALVDWNSFCLRLMGPICSFGEQSKFDALTHSELMVLVDLNGKRFVAEPMVPRTDPFETGHILIQHPKGRAFFLYSANTLRKMIQNSERAPHDGPFGMPPLPPLEEIDGWFREAVEKGSREAAVADTVEELAQLMGVDPAALCETVEEYNASCAEGVDWKFFKDPCGLEPLSEGPFYALGGKLSTDGASGGVRVNPEMQAYRADGSLVEGLYAAGDFASGRHIVMDKVKKQILNDMSWALSSGFLAGTNAAKSLM